MGTKTCLFYEESYNFFKRNFGGKILKEIPPNPCLLQAVKASKINLKGLNVLDVGCGGGQNSYWLTEEKGCHCTGIEPHPKTVKLLAKAYPNIGFKVGVADHLPFETNSFDLVLLRASLTVVDRNLILQALGEATRVTRKWLILSDFAPLAPFRVPYKHRPGIYTWHVDCTEILQMTGILNLKFSQYSTVKYVGDKKEVLFIDKKEINNKTNIWDLMRTVIFEKKMNLLPEKDEKDFFKGKK